MRKPAAVTTERPLRTEAPPRELVFGLHAALAVHRVRPEAIQRAWFLAERMSEFGGLLRALAAGRKPYHQCDARELERVAGSVHHEGLCLAVTPRVPLTLEQLAARLKEPTAGWALALDDVANPHNLGAILRSCAWFGARGLLATQALTPAAVRVAEGGAEVVPVLHERSLVPALQALRAQGVRIVGTDTRATKGLFSMPLQAPGVLVLGNEHEGLSAATRACCDDVRHIPGAALVESLNVSVAAGVVLAAAMGRSAK